MSIFINICKSYELGSYKKVFKYIKKNLDELKFESSISFLSLLIRRCVFMSW